MAQTIAEDCALVDFGSASLDKIILLLDALEEQKKQVTYYALDLSYSELEATLRTLPLQKYQHVECAALHGTFDDGLEWIRNGPRVKNRPHCAMFLGSTIGDFSMTNSAEFVRNMAISALSGRPNDWYYLSEYNHLLGRHEAYCTPRNRAIRLGAPLDYIVVQKGEKIRFGYSHKYDEEERNALFGNAGVTVGDSWTAPGCDLAFFQAKLSDQS